MIHHDCYDCAFLQDRCPRAVPCMTGSKAVTDGFAPKLWERSPLTKPPAADDLYCVSCGAYCGEGRQVCRECEGKE